MQPAARFRKLTSVIFTQFGNRPMFFPANTAPQLIVLTLVSPDIFERVSWVANERARKHGEGSHGQENGLYPACIPCTYGRAGKRERD